MSASLTAFPPSPPQPGQQMQQTPVSYETYAPRSSLQRDRLSRIAELTAGPENRFRKSSNTGADSATPVLHNISTTSLSIRTSIIGADQEEGYDDGFNNGEESLFAFTTTTKPTATTTTCVPGEVVGERLVVQRSQRIALLTTKSISQSLHHSESIKRELSIVLEKAQELQHRHSELLKHSGELALQCERLQQEEALLSEHAADVGHPLQHYDTVDAVALQLGVLFKERNGHALMVVKGLPRLKVDNHEEYTSVLDKVYEAMAYFTYGATQQLSQVTIYATKATSLHDSALRLIKEAVADRITSITSDIQQSYQNGNNNNALSSVIPADKLEASLIYTRFHGISSRSNSLLLILQQRIARPIGQYRELLEQCQHVYCSSRELLLQPSIRKHMEKLKEEHGLVGMTRLASVFLMRVCTVETYLYLDFFGIPPAVDSKDDNTSTSVMQQNYHAISKNKPSSVLYDEQLQKMLGGLCSHLHRIVRRGVVLLSEMDVLCQVVSVLREERTAANASVLTRAVARSMSSMIEDAQERLIFCTLSTLTKDVVKFRTTPSDLDYPNKLLVARSAATTSTTFTAAEDAVHAQMQVYESWFPPMRTVLKVLSKLFRVVDPKVFEDIAFQAVQSCTKSLKEAAHFIRVKEGDIDGDLFLVKHLLILREQLSPFDIQLRAVERQLDFSEAGKAVTKFLASRNRRIFSMSTENALLTLLREGVSIHEASIDSKRDLEDALRSACNDFIEHSSIKIAGPLLNFIDSCKSTAAATSSISNKTNTNASAVKGRAFMTTEAVSTIIEQTKESLQAQVNSIKQQMTAYLESAAAQGILLKPVTRKISRALEDLKRFVADAEECESNGWNEISKAEMLESSRGLESLFKEPGTSVFKIS